MKGARVGLVAALLLCLAGGDQARGGQPQPNLHAELARLVSAGSPGALVLVGHDGRVSTLTSGLAVRDPRTPLRANATFRIGSLTKTQVATVVLQLAGEGKLSLADSVSRHLPGLVPHGDRITIRQLLDHTSGIPEFDTDPRVLAPYLHGNLGYSWSPRRLVGIAVSHASRSAPGARYSYSNTNYLLLGLIVEAVTGRPLGDVLRARIYEPLGLTDTTFETSAARTRPRMHGYFVLGKPPADDITALSPYPWASGAVVSTAADVAAFYRALLNGRLLRPELLSEMQSTVGEGAKTDFRGERYGLGIESYPTPAASPGGTAATSPATSSTRSRARAATDSRARRQRGPRLRAGARRPDVQAPARQRLLLGAVSATSSSSTIRAAQAPSGSIVGS